MKITSESASVISAMNNASSAVKQTIESDSGLTPEQKSKLKEAVDNTTVPSVEVPNTFVYRIAVAAIGAIAGVIVVGALVLAFVGGEVPNFLQMALATTIGALAGMVVPTPKAA